jgi:hypothetical protein
MDLGRSDRCGRARIRRPGVSGFGFALIATPLVAVLAGPRERWSVSRWSAVLVAQVAIRGRGHVDGSIVLLMSAAPIVASLLLAAAAVTAVILARRSRERAAPAAV